MASNKGKALKTLVKKPTSVCASLVPNKNRLEWTAQEENFLVDEFALRKVGSYTFNFILFFILHFNSCSLFTRTFSKVPMIML